MAESLSLLSYVLIAIAAFAAGAVNAIAGGGTLITFPVLVAVGIPPVASNVTNTVALSPGYLGGTYAQRNDLRGQKRRLWLFLPASVIGGLVGGLLLLRTNEKVFTELVPWLILLASGLLAIQGQVRKWLTRRASAGHKPMAEGWAILPVFLAAVYGGYFGAGLSVIVLAVLGLVIDDTLTRLNAMKQAVAFAVNIAAALFFIFSGMVVWSAAVVMAVAALLGGVVGGRFAGSVKPEVLRAIVVTIGIIVAIIYFVR